MYSLILAADKMLISSMNRSMNKGFEFYAVIVEREFGSAYNVSKGGGGGRSVA